MLGLYMSRFDYDTKTRCIWTKAGSECFDHCPKA